MPFMPMQVKNGVPRHPDGKEVTLWDVNYYPKIKFKFEKMKMHGIDKEKRAVVLKNSASPFTLKIDDIIMKSVKITSYSGA